MQRDILQRQMDAERDEAVREGRRVGVSHASEHEEQKALFQWAALAAPGCIELTLLYAIPNGGHRHKAVASKLKAEGVKSGVPDICLPVARGPYHGLYIEMKVGRNKESESQRGWREALMAQGYFATVCYGWMEARSHIESYLGGIAPVRARAKEVEG